MRVTRSVPEPVSVPAAAALLIVLSARGLNMAPGPIVIVPETLRLVTALTMALLFEMAKFLNDVAEKPPIVWAFEPLKMTAAVVLGVKVPPLSYQLPLTVIGNVDAASVPDVSVKFPLIVVAAPSVVRSCSIGER